MRSRLGRTEWIRGALATLAAGGVDAVRVETLAIRLRVTKGSFYWHFEDKPALLAAVLETWEARATGDVIAMVEARAADAGGRLRSLLTIAFAADGRLELAIRAWASRGDASVRASLDRIDRRRRAYVEQLFADLGFSTAAAAMRARILYVALTGQFTGGASDGPRLALPDDVDLFFRMLVSPIPLLD